MDDAEDVVLAVDYAPEDVDALELSPEVDVEVDEDDEPLLFEGVFFSAERESLR